MNELKLDAADIKKWRGYVMTEDVLPGNGLEIFPRGKHERSYVLPGHGLAILATAVFLLIYLLINSRIDPESHLTALVYLLILLITWVWVLAGATFFFDAHRLPVMLALAAWLFVAGWFPRSDHFYRIWPVRQTIADAEANALTAHVSAAELQESPLGPAEILADAQAK